MSEEINYAQRSEWPFHHMLPYLICFYPMPQSGKKIGPQTASSWPPKMHEGVRKWRVSEPHLDHTNHHIYVHVPFCPFICDYCHFYKVTDTKDRNVTKQEEYVQTVIKEITAYGQNSIETDKVYRSVYFGGGTPTQLKAEQLIRIVDAIRQNYTLSEDCEITVEGMGQQMLKAGFLETLFEGGVNRLSYGVQSMDLDVREAVGRRGEKVNAYQQVVEHAKAINPNVKVNVDVMAGLPKQTTESVLQDLQAISDWGMDSIDIYWYVMIPGTPLFKKILSGDEESNCYGERMLEMRLAIRKLLGECGFDQLTGENFSRSDRHQFATAFYAGGGNALNTVLGFGPSAQGTIAGNVYRNITELNEYIERVNEGRFPVNNNVRLDVKTARRRALLFSLIQFRVPFELVYTSRDKKRFAQWEKMGLLSREEREFVLTEKGITWFNNMQLECLTIGDLRELTPMAGSVEDRRRLIAQDNGFAREYRRLVRNSDGVMGDLRMLSYKTMMSLEKLMPNLDSRSVGWSGKRLDSDSSNERLKVLS